MAKPSLFIESFFIFFILISLYSPSLGCPIDQKEALLQFKSILASNLKINYTSLDAFGSWNSNSNCCQWDKVTCQSDTVSKQVIGLKLGYVIPSHTYTAVSSNVLTPLFHIRTLMSLDISGNWIYGEIPGTGFANLTNLVNLVMSHNKFDGSIPPQLFSLKYLNYLDLSYNQLEGSFPLWLAEIDLQFLILSDNKLSGSLPPRLFRPQTLVALDLSRNNFSGRLPDNIGEATGISILILSGNNFSGPVPKSISNISQLLLLDLSRNRFSGNFDPMTSLMHVDISFNKFSGEVPLNFGPWTKTLILSQNEFSGHLHQNLTGWSWLGHLDLSNNYITGDIPTFFSQMSFLEVLNLRSNSLEGSIPSDLSNLTSLRILDLSNNNLNGQIPPSLGNLTGMIEKSNESSLVGIVFPNPLPGFDPQYDLEVYWKNLMRGLPINNLYMYSFLDISKNQLSGEIPLSLGGLKILKALNMSYNNFSGNIPASFGDFQSLESLDLSHNNLSGGIPQTFAKLQELTTLDLSNNKLTGRIPEGPQMDRLNDPNFYANNSGLCGVQILEPCQEVTPPIKPLESESRETLFSWEMAGIGYPFGLVTTVLVIYCIGYFQVAPQRHQRHHAIRRL